MVADTTVVTRRTGRSTPPTCDSSRTAGRSAARSRDDVNFSLPSLVRALFIILVGAADEPRRREATDDLRTACQLALPASRQRISRCSMRLPYRYQTQSRPVSASPEFAAFRLSYLIARPPRNGLGDRGPRNAAPLPAQPRIGLGPSDTIPACAGVRECTLDRTNHGTPGRRGASTTGSGACHTASTLF